ncbi:MAG: threonine-phosphate decarboxylase [Bradyrhizobium sp.]|uniref:threonine-phosphate decarboxylase CobD n=1 Tax=Bradyrhizobium sp. TaxID=376 RepID=UPI001C29CD13|nr:threonine-phosphate decarboxylase CobD [Bradyrhizobium sp.]MBU6461994.1 threonine-phosphate decarboxylase [Pseudomonadota bacterium]MDE2066091.1 threonine-phosphate decarboxylase [Bradyrhizobium sp.]MDE2240979.1 threonine-phosphate decarboxylase [Bradyrhizobium sp.]MDE2469933.1 threonine-phosphate decarboxylase [Bradyrhizobium sp.]
MGKGIDGLRIHGGRIDLAASLYPSAPKPWIDLSTGINPIPWPVPAISPARYQRLPFASEITEMTAAASAAYGLPGNARMLPVPGSELAIGLLPRMIGDGRVGILAPTYGSHASAWRAAGADVHEFAELSDMDRPDLKTLVVVNPNNPDGRIISCADLAAFGRTTTSNGGHLIVDEAFADVRPDVSLLALPELPAGTIVLRSLGKFFGLAGLRVGFVIVTEQDATVWRQLLGDWPVSGPACEIATSALRDSDWIAATRKRLAKERKRLDSVLSQAGLKLLGGTDLFGLFEAPDGIDLLDHFARAGILVRGFAGAARQYRFGLPADEPGWRRLEAACVTLR